MERKERGLWIDAKVEVCCPIAGSFSRLPPVFARQDRALIIVVHYIELDPVCGI